MSSGIYYNQTVTTDILNGIAKDLGNTSFNGFTTSKFGADELNKITKSLVTSGVLLSDNACEPKAVGNSVVIQTGTIVFENGAKIQLAEAKTFDKTASKVIYALNNVSEGTASIVMSDDYPESGTDFVKLASIDANGAVNDERKFANVKVRYNCTGVWSTTVTVTESVPITITPGIKNWKVLKYSCSYHTGLYDREQDIGYGERGRRSGYIAYNLPGAYGSCSVDVNSDGSVTFTDGAWSDGKHLTTEATITFYGGDISEGQEAN